MHKGPVQGYPSVAPTVAADLLVAAVVAVATPLFNSKEPAIATWGTGGIVVFAIVARTAAHSLSSFGQVKKVVGGVLMGLGVSATAAFVGFVLMVNIWERLGLGH